MKYIKQVLSSMKVEGLKPSEKGMKITSAYLENKISSKQAINAIKKYHLGNRKRL
jgi:hypothetical protein